jgi:hypothetical protein
MLAKRFIATTVAVLAVGLPSAALAKPGPLGLETAEETSPPPVVQSSNDLRSPDARDAAVLSTAIAAQDLRSPDAREAGTTGSLAGTVSSPDTAPAAVQAVTTDDGFEWSSAGIGAAAMLAIVLALIAAAALVPRRHVRSLLVH